MPRDPNDLLYGTLDVLVLKTLGAGPLHGYAIASAIEQRAGGALDIVDAALYKALHRLEADGAVTGEWGLSDSARTTAPARGGSDLASVRRGRERRARNRVRRTGSW